MKYLILLLFFLKNNEFSSAEESEEALDTSNAVVLKMDHSFDHGKTYSSRGSITIHSLRSGAVLIQQNDLTKESKAALEKLCEVDGLYLIRAVINQEAISSFRSAVHACNLMETGLADNFNVQLDWRHKIVALQLSTPSIPNKVPLSTLPGFKTRVFVQHMESGPAPDTASFIQKMEEEKLAKQRGETKDNRSFFAK